jgi:hypothetical protein
VTDLTQMLLAEDDPEILGFRCSQTGVLLWPHVRIAFFRMMMSDLLYAAPLPVSAAAQLSPRALSTLSRSLLSNARLRLGGRCRADVCVMATAVGVSQRDGKWFNRLSDYFALLLPEQTLLVEDQFDWKWPQPRRVERVLFHAPLQVRNALIGRALAGAAHERAAQQLISLVAQRAKRFVGWELGSERERRLVGMLAQRAAAIPHQYRSYRALLARIAPRVLLKEEACYGTASTLLVAAADLGIVTAEYQHGAISAGHDAYNLAPTLRDSSEYRRMLPQHFLGYGRWWNEQIDVPVNKLAIGNPHRDACLAGGRTVADKTDVIVLGDGIETSAYLAFARELAPRAARNGLRTVFRPHPLERGRVAATEGVQVDDNVDIYDSLRAAHLVVSEVSTGLFEAVGFADRIVVWDTPKARFGYPRHPFGTVAGAAELAERIGDRTFGVCRPEAATEIWAPCWQESYLQFLQACGVRPAPARVSA